MNWGTYSERQSEKIGDKFLHTTKFTYQDGLVTFRWYVSPNRTNSYEACLWKDKNPRARKPERKYCLTRGEARQVAKLNRGIAGQFPPNH